MASHTLVPGSQGTQTLKQSLKDLQEMLKITQNKLAKSNKPQSAAPMDDASFLKKLSRQNEMSQTGVPAPHMLNSTLQYASRYGQPPVVVVNSPKYKENAPDGGNPGSSSQPPKHHGNHQHHKRASNSFQQTQPINGYATHQQLNDEEHINITSVAGSTKGAT